MEVKAPRPRVTPGASVGSYSRAMTVLAAFSIAPGAGPSVGEDGSVGRVVAEVVRIVRESGLPNETNAMFTNVEGTLDEVLELIKRCTQYVASIAPRVSVVVKLDVREGHAGALHEKVAVVERLIGTDSQSSDVTTPRASEQRA